MKIQGTALWVAVAFGCGVDEGGRATGEGDGGLGDSASPDDDSDASEGSGSASQASDGQADGNDGAEDGGDDDVIYDVGDGAPVDDCTGTSGTDNDYAYIWIANSPQGTMSKINTETLVEEARYYVRPDHNGSPSRTSVGLSGNVAVAARQGGISKFYANPDECGAGATSQGADDIKPFPDPCLAWHTDFPYSSQRGVAWAPADWDPVSCEYKNEKLWSAGVSNVVEVALLDGETGVVENSVQVPEANGGVGVYGAAVDSQGNFWGWVPAGSKLLRVDRQTLTAELWNAPSGGYGITVDHKDRPWLCAGQASRFDPATQMFATVQAGGGITGCMEDGQGTLWIGTSNGINGIDIDALIQDKHLDVPGFIKGISIQENTGGQLYIWGVSQSQEAYKVDPISNTYETFTGLNSPYTYSDMTGFALANVSGDPSG